ncbi:uncharacterized protein SPPG_08439 [Spizellomyces punctatus DAOM BR117]|uniref:PIN domain-containing protein n=1 Tax=Spizellomyces punctatus (strain DAOM BR117) TaxID=645134 RepID=A0A0L0H4Z6_SPIPD|nr:uncharacterized protein SPPG_08439 [Spizellomyces punctatus DAOM BR117]KNC96287.1 hypothetical protein SPPG_08439 [Spizellomyces punctatus DAOM BR117]|eukprot:XP_016604327.1 hypothetical protein SPPG_08439 [Spizellomyces punctatus DAOM BR117]
MSKVISGNSRIGIKSLSNLTALSQNGSVSPHTRGYLRQKQSSCAKDSSEDAQSDDEAPDSVDREEDSESCIFSEESSSDNSLSESEDESDCAPDLTNADKAAEEEIKTVATSIRKVRGRGAVGGGMYSDLIVDRNSQTFKRSHTQSSKKLPSSQDHVASRHGRARDRKGRHSTTDHEEDVFRRNHPANPHLYDPRSTVTKLNRPIEGVTESKISRNGNGSRPEEDTTRRSVLKRSERDRPLDHRNVESGVASPHSFELFSKKGENGKANQGALGPRRPGRRSEDPQVSVVQELERLQLRDEAPYFFDQLKQMYKSICKIEETLANEKKSVMVTRSDYQTESIRKRTATRLSLGKLYADIIGSDYNLGIKYDLETRLWRNSVYSCIESLRANVTAESGKLSPPVHAAWIDFIVGAQVLYRLLIGRLKRHRTKTESSSPIWHRSLNCLADLARYNTLYLYEKPSAVQSDKDWSVTKRLYKEAALLCPHNGLYYNQLAITSMYEERHLEALHYYLRSLTVRSPFANARDSLTFLFESNRKCIEIADGRPTAAVNSVKTLSRSRKTSDNICISGDRKPIAIMLNLFVRLHEIFYSKISTERFTEYFAMFAAHLNNVSSMLRIPSDENFSVWFRLAAVNASMSYLSKINPAMEKDGGLDQIRENLISTSIHILDVAVKEEINALHTEYDNAELRQEVPVTAGLLYIEVTILWLINTASVWVPYITVQKYSRFWSSMAILCNSLARALNEEVRNPLSVSEIISSRLLPEDWELRGSLPFKESHNKIPGFDAVMTQGAVEIDRFVAEHVDVAGNVQFQQAGQQHASVRSLRILVLARILAEKVPVFYYDPEQKSFSYRKQTLDMVESVAPELAKSDDNVQEEEEEEEVDYEPYPFETQNGVESDAVEVDHTVQHLKALRQKLHGTLTSQQRTMAPTQLRDKRTTSVRVVPGETVIVFDTNIFLHRLQEVKHVIESGDWIVSIPLVVVTELDGLKISDDEKGLQALHAVQYLEEEFGDGTSSTGGRRRKPWLKLQTSQGNFLFDLRVRTENWATRSTADERRKNNDDVILKCCQYHKDNQKDGTASPVVLVTDDVNMKLKARTMGIEVVDKVPRTPRTGKTSVEHKGRKS